jgi:cytoskeletal protein RodZ
MFGNLIKLLLLAVIVASVAILARNRLQPPAPAADEASVTPAVPAERAPAVPTADLPPKATSPAEESPAAPSAETAASAEPSNTGEAETRATAPETSTAPEEDALADRRSMDETANQPGESVAPEGAALRPMQPEPADAGAEESAQDSAPAAAEETGETVSPEAMPVLPPVHPGPDDTSLPPTTIPEQPPLTQ